MARPNIPSSYVVDLRRIMEDILDETDKKGWIDVVIPVYNNSFGRETAERMIFLDQPRMWRSIKSEFIEAIEARCYGAKFRIYDKFLCGNECGYRFGSVEVSCPDGEGPDIVISYYWR